MKNNSQKKDNMLSFFSVVCIANVSLMFIVSTSFIISQSINAIKVYHNISCTNIEDLLKLKEYFNSSITEQIYSLIYAFMSTAIVGLGGYILKKNNATKEEIQKNMRAAGKIEFQELKKTIDNNSNITFLISDVVIANQYVCAMDIATDKDEYHHSFGDVVKKIETASQSIYIITTEQKDNILTTLLSIQAKYDLLKSEGLNEQPDDHNNCMSDYLQKAIYNIEQIPTEEIPLKK